MKSTLIRWLPILALALLPAFAGAAQNVLSNSPLAEMNDDDLALARSSIGTALEESADGEIRNWVNTKSGASGTVKPTKTFERDAMKCRTVELHFEARGKTADSGWNLCKTGDGWKILGAS